MTELDHMTADRIRDQLDREDRAAIKRSISMALLAIAAAGAAAFLTHPDRPAPVDMGTSGASMRFAASPDPAEPAGASLHPLPGERIEISFQ